MADLRQQIGTFPHKPGCYLFKDTGGSVLYVGKAKDLRKRVSQYFGQDKRPQLPFLIEDASTVDYIVAHTELEALFLENTLIKKHSPKYNIKLKDDKNYAFIVIDHSTEIPQIGYARKIEEDRELQIFLNPSAAWGSGKRQTKFSKTTTKKVLSLRGGSALRTDEAVSNQNQIATSTTPRNDKAKANDYFGPYSSVKKIRETLDFVRRIFPYCANTEIGNRPCFYYHLHRCPGICVGAISLEEYEQNLARIKLFLNGKTALVKKEVRSTMERASKQKRFELAARLRDQLRSLEILEERQIAQFPTKVNYDFVSLANESGLYCINLFKVRDGRLTDKENFIYTISQLQNSTLSNPDGRQKQISAIENQVVQIFAERYYAETTDIPNSVFTQHAMTEESLISELLKTRKGKKVDIAIPHRGKPSQLIKLGHLNAEECLRKQLESDATNIDKLNEALKKLQQLLKLPKLPTRIECYDMSNTQGTNPVGSMVVFVDGKPAKFEYRKFKIRSKDTPDDFAMMRETLARRLARIPNSQFLISNENANAKSWPTPDLIVIDGGKGQLSAALEAQTNFLEASSSKLEAIPMIGLAKRIEEIFLPNNPEPIILSHDEPALQMLQRLRDEAHRFGITFHRSLRSKQATKSALDTIPGIGPKTKKLLKQKFGTVATIKQKSLDELAIVIGEAKAKIVKENL